MTSGISSGPVNLAIFASHPIQYQVPWFKALAESTGIDLRVYYSLIPTAEQQGVGFGIPFDWDIPLLDGYDWERLPSRSGGPSLERFLSCRTKGALAFVRERLPGVAVLTGWHYLVLLQALRACNQLGIPCLVRGDSNALRPRPWWTRLLHRILLGRYDGFLATGRANRDFYISHGVDAKQVFPCPHFVDNQRFAASAAELVATRDQIRLEWAVPADATCFLFAGKLIPKKRPLDLLEALRVARSGGRRLHALIVGDGILLERCRRIAEREDLPVTFAGFLNQSEIARAYVASDCLVLPSDYGETWGLVVNEAMACGRPAIVSDRVGCGPDLVEPGSTGFVFPFGNVPALAETLVAAAGDRTALLRMGERGRQRVFSDYSVERAVEGTLSAVEAVLASGR